jgi:DNA polymerase-3 subunit epsilon
VLDFETTGVDPDCDEVVEFAVVHLDASGRRERVIASTVRPVGAMAGSEIHGLSMHDVADSPTMRALAPVLADALADRVVVAHNAYFDIRFAAAALSSATGRQFPRVPVVCTMFSSKVVGLGGFVSLVALCDRLGVPLSDAHAAAADASATADCLLAELAECRRTGGHLHRFGDPEAPLLAPGWAGPADRTLLRPRRGVPASIPS